MDGSRFDGLSRAFAAAGSRRGVLAVAFSVMLGGVLPAAGAAAGSVRCRPAGRACATDRQCCNGRCRTGKRVPIASRNLCECDAPSAMCGKNCRDLGSDPNHCGRCGKQVGANERCCDGSPTAIDTENCAACGDVCGPDDSCCADTGGCADRLTDPANCGACGVVCDSGECVDGACVSLRLCLADGAACQLAGACCSLTCAGGVCSPPADDCTAYTGAAGNYTTCYRKIGASLGSVVDPTVDLPCGRHPDVPANLADSCASDADCAAAIERDGVADVVGHCVDLSVFCTSPGTCYQTTIPSAAACLMVFAPEATC